MNACAFSRDLACTTSKEQMNQICQFLEKNELLNFALCVLLGAGLKKLKLIDFADLRVFITLKIVLLRGAFEFMPS